MASIPRSTIYFVVFGLFWLLWTPSKALGHNPHPPAHSTPEADFNISGGILVESDDPAPKLLVVAQFNGFEQKTGQENLVYKYFWVSAQLEFNTQPGDGPVLDTYIINMVPAIRETENGDGSVSGLRYLPVEIRSDPGLRLRNSISVQALGWSYEAERHVAAGSRHEFLAHMIAFAQIAVDVVGLRLATLGEPDAATSFLGGQAGVIQARAGLGWELSKNVTLRISLNAVHNASLGKLARSDRPTLLAELEAWARLELALKTSIASFMLYLDGGHHLYRQLELGRGPEFERDHWYMIVSLASEF